MVFLGSSKSESLQQIAGHWPQNTQWKTRIYSRAHLKSFAIWADSPVLAGCSATIPENPVFQLVLSQSLCVMLWKRKGSVILKWKFLEQFPWKEEQVPELILLFQSKCYLMKTFINHRLSKFVMCITFLEKKFFPALPQLWEHFCCTCTTQGRSGSGTETPLTRLPNPAKTATTFGWMRWVEMLSTYKARQLAKLSKRSVQPKAWWRRNQDVLILASEEF